MTEPSSFAQAFTPENPLRIGTRRSPLALAQAEMAAAAIAGAHGLSADAIRLVPMLSSGDKNQDQPLADIGGKALWTKELERALLDGEIDMSVHSMKDVETVRPEIYRIAAMLPRADVRDRLIGAASIDALPKNAMVGTSSPRRAAQLLAIRPDLNIAPIRGNVATRLAQIESGAFGATMLAAAGLDRLSHHNIGAVIEVDMMLPAASQGAIGLETSAQRPEMLQLLAAANHAPTFDCVMAERAFLAALGGSCHSPVAALAVIDGTQIWLRGEILSEDGSERQSGDIRFGTRQAGAPAALAAALLARSSSALAALFSA
jgi:hydroxymethylbilane synthase